VVNIFTLIISNSQDLRYCHNFLLVDEAKNPINSFYFVQSVTQRKNFKCASYVSPNSNRHLSEWSEGKLPFAPSNIFNQSIVKLEIKES